MNRRSEVAVELAARKDAVGVSGAVELELVHTVVANELEAGIAKALRSTSGPESAKPLSTISYPCVPAASTRCCFGLP